MKNFHYPDRPHVGIGVVVWRGDKLLLVKRKNPPGQGQWGLPGGKQKLGETLFAAAFREVREETGVEIEPLGIITAIDVITRDDKDKIEYHYTVVEIAADWKKGEARAGDDAIDIRWVNVEEVKSLCDWDEVARVARLSMLERIL